MEPPRFFVDRSLGRIRVPGLLREAGWSLVTLADHYGIPQDERIADGEWLQLAGAEGWPVLMKDDRIRYRPAEKEALITHGVTAFSISGGNLTSAQIAEILIHHKSQIWAAAAAAGPAVYVVSRTKLRRADL